MFYRGNCKTRESSKIALLSQLASLSPRQPARGWLRQKGPGSLAALAACLRIIDFSRGSSFAIASCKLLCLSALSLILSGCGYRFQESQADGDPVSICVPYISGDDEGQLNNAIVRKIAENPLLEYHRNRGALTLLVSIIGDGSDRIGYQYDRNPTTGQRRKNILATENRRTLSAEVKLVETASGDVVVGPTIVKASADYDYVDAHSIVDLTFVPPHGRPQTVLDFSLGQLDSIEGAHDDAGAPIYQTLAQKIVEGLNHHLTLHP
jgi:hypothetical protein